MGGERASQSVRIKKPDKTGVCRHRQVSASQEKKAGARAGARNRISKILTWLIIESIHRTDGGSGEVE